MTGDTYHQCPRDGCTRRVRRDQLACREDWAKVSRSTQRRVYGAYNTDDIVDHADAMTLAIAEMNSGAPRIMPN